MDGGFLHGMTPLLLSGAKRKGACDSAYWSHGGRFQRAQHHGWRWDYDNSRLAAQN